MKKVYFFLIVLIGLLLMVSTCRDAEAKGVRGRSHSSVKTKSVKRSENAKARTREPDGTFAKQDKKAPDTAAGGGLANSIVGASVGATAGTLIGNALYDSFSEEHDENCEELIDADPLGE